MNKTKTCRNILCPHTNPQPISNFYTYIRKGKTGYRSYCKPCYASHYAQPSPEKKAEQKRKREQRRQEEIQRFYELNGFIPRKYRTGPEEIPYGKFWCTFCEELHDDDPSRCGSSRCPEYRAYIINRWRQNPVNKIKERKYIWVWKRKQQIIKLLNNNGFEVKIKFSYPINAFIIEVLPDSRRMIRIPPSSSC